MEESVRIWNLKTEYMENPLGIDEKRPVFHWQMESKRYGAAQRAYRILVWEEKTAKIIKTAKSDFISIISVDQDKDKSVLVWDSGKIVSEQSVAVLYQGRALFSKSRYYWKVIVWDEQGMRVESDTAWFETGLMGTGKEVWNGAEFIGSPKAGINTAALENWCYQAEFRVEKGNQAGFVMAARDRENYVLFEVDLGIRSLKAYAYSDCAWKGSRESGAIPTVTPLGEEMQKEKGYWISKEAVPEGTEEQVQQITWIVKKQIVTVKINGVAIIEQEADFLPGNPPNQPRRAFLMLVGLKQLDSRAFYQKIMISDAVTNEIYLQEDFADSKGVFSALGTVKNGELEVKHTFELVCPCPGLHLKKIFYLDTKAHGGIQTARIYASARGSYEIYLNGTRVGEEYLAPGFTDYRIRIPYQTYPVESYLKEGKNHWFAMVGKGYYSGYCGYSGAMIYGRENAFLAQLVIDYQDGTEEIIKTDETWMYTGKGPLVDSDYLDGEIYDARLEEGVIFDGKDEDIDKNRKTDNNKKEAAEIKLLNGIWKSCGKKEWAFSVQPTNGNFKKEPKFELSAQIGSGAKVERILKPIAVWENPKGHFIYDFGQNMVGTVRLKVKAKRGTSIRLRYGEMCYKNGELYLQNIRTAANTDIYICKGAEQGEEFVPSFTSHGFRYVEITGNGFLLTDCSFMELEGLVLCNTIHRTGDFCCSNPQINQLQKNIEWGQRGNYLLVPTDCPQRNERMGWTGDAQIFAGTAVFHMDSYIFLRKWLQDLRDSQLLYHKNGAVPDTAPLGGDNRTDGCAGWGDAAVIVPWELYLAYGDIRILKENYPMMQQWTAYQSKKERQNYGIRTVDGVKVPNQSDFASIPFLQVQQRRGDHLTFDESTPFILSATAYAAYTSDLMGKIAQLLGKEKDAAYYKERFFLIRQAFCEAWVKEDGTLGYWGEMSKSNLDANGNQICSTYYSNEEGNPNHPSQTAYALAIDFGLIPKEKLDGARRGLLQAILDRNRHISTGFLGISHINPALSKAGLSSEAFALLEQEENPSWLYSVKNGATTIWERWDSYNAKTDTFGDAAMNSFNHYAYGAVGEWMYREILGIRTSEKAGEQGYKKVILKPAVGGTLTSAKGYYDSPYGRIVSDWELEENGENGKTVSYCCHIPANTTGEVILPVKSRVIEGKNGILLQTKTTDMVFCLQSGQYRFQWDIGKSEAE